MRHLLLLIAFISCVACEGPRLEKLGKAEQPAEVVPERFAAADIRFRSNANILVYGAMVFLAIIDHSGSNYIEPYVTDPTADRRYNSLIQLCEELKGLNNSNIFAGLITFGTAPTAAQPITNNLGTACQKFAQTKLANLNLGYTDYLQSLALASSQLSTFLNARQNDAQRYKLAVAFITDGVPRIIGEVIQNSDAIRTAVRGLRTLASGYPGIVEEFRFHTAYYDRAGNVSVPAVTLLRDMAADGYGTFTQFVNNEELDITAFLPARLARTHHVDQVWAVGDMSWDLVDGKPEMSVDRDMDGLSDRREAELGCNPTAKDTNGNGFSDLVEYRAYGDCFGIRLPLCPFPLDKESDNDGLTDCEEQILNERLQLATSPTNPISSPSGLPDLLAFRHDLFSLGALQGDPDLDAISSVRELSLWLPPLFANGSVPFKGLLHRIEEGPAASDGVRDYHWTINRIPLLGGESGGVLRLLVPQYLDGAVSPTLKTAEKRIENLSVTFRPEDFR